MKKIYLLLLLFCCASIVGFAQCAGKPNGGSALSSVSPVITSGSFTLSLSGASSGSGITYQWQISACGTSWANIGGATSATLNTTQTAANMYRCMVTCTNSSISTPSSPVYVSRIAASYCNLTAFYGCSYGDQVKQFLLTGSCGSTINYFDPGCAGTNVNMTATVVKLQQGGTYSGSICADYAYSERGRVWIDLDDNGSFDASELLWSNGSGHVGEYPTTSAVSISIAAGAPLGKHRMRVIVQYSNTSTASCPALGSYGYGNQVDFTAEIIPAASLSSNSPACASTALITASPNLSCGANYNWSGPSGFTATYTNINTFTPSVSGTYALTITANGATSCSQSTSFTVNSSPSLASISNNGPLCAGNNLTFTTTGPTNVAGYSWSGPVAISGAATATVSSATTGATGNYSVVVNSAGGCTATYTSSATVNASPTAITGTQNLCTGNPTTFASTPLTGTWSSQSAAIASVNASGVVSGLAVGNTNITYALSGGCFQTRAVSVNVTPNVSNFTSPTATNSCSGSGSIVTVHSTTLAAGTYTVTYNLSGANAATGSTATLTMGAGSGTFSIPTGALATEGTNTVTITRITGNGSCFSTVSSSNTATFVVGTTPNASNFTSTTATSVCFGAGSVVEISSSSLGAGTFVANFDLTGVNAVSGATASITMGAATGTFTIPSSLIPAIGANNIIINSIADVNGCAYTTPTNNTAAFTTSQNSELFNITGGGSYCSSEPGAVVGLSGSTTGNSYQLYRGATTVGSPVNGTGASISFGAINVAGTYSVMSTNTSSSCTRAMAGTVNVLSAIVPGVYTVTGGGGYCIGGSGVTINQSGSDVGFFYQLYNGATVVGSPVMGTGAPISLGVYTTSGSYTVIGNPGTACATTMSGSASVVINPLPTAYSVTGGGNYCSGGTGSAIGLSFGSSGVQYTLYNGSSPVSTVGGTNAALSFGSITTAGTYSVGASVVTTGCVNNMSGTATVAVTPLPTAFAVSGGGSYCSGSAGIPVGMANSTSGVSYQLYNGATAVGSPVASTGGAFNFGTMTGAGVYSATATSSGCSTNMTGTATVIINATPPVFTVGGSTAYCGGGTGGTVTLNGSTAGVNYQLYQGSTALGAPVAGTGAALSLGTYTTAATYSVMATNPVTTCSSNMSGTAVISIKTPPTSYNVGGGGGYCVGSIGTTVTLSGSQTGVNYQLYRSGLPVGGPLAGSGSNLSFGYQTEEGVYTVIATNILNGCATTMAGSAVVSINVLPTIYPVTGGGNYCSGTPGVEIGVGGSTPGVSYYLYNGATLIGTSVAGTNLPISFGIQTLTGTYTVFALNTVSNCTNNMSGSASIGINPLPTVYPVTGTGSYCAGGAGLAVGLSASTTGVNYSLYNGSSLVSVIPGTGSAISFGLMTAAGTYTVQANNATTACTRSMAGNAVITVNSLPLQHTVTSTGTNYCAGGAGITVGLGTSTSGINYQLYNGSSMVGIPTTSTGGPISFGAKTAAGVYSVIATDPTTGCTKNMLGTATITIDALPVVYSVTGGGSYCNGGTGVSVGLSGSEVNTSYQLYNGAAAVGASVPGTGAAISFGAQLTAATYTVVASNAAGCTKNMTGSATVSINMLPTAQTVTGGGVYCAGGTGMPVSLTSSQTGVNYQLYNGSTPIGSPIPGTGAALSLGTQTATGTYMVTASNPVTGCANNMSGFATIATNAAPTVYNVTGGGSYCAGGTGVHVMLSGSTSGISYQLMNGTMPVGTAVTGTGAGLDFGAITTAGNYFVSATNGTTTCMSTMAGSAAVVVNALPTVYAVTGSDNYCVGGTGVHVGLSGSTTGIAYQLYNGATSVGSFVSGTGLALDFGLKTAGDYSVIAYNPATTCFTNMLGAANVIANPLPVVHSVTGGGAYCNGGTGVNIGLSNSTPGTSYQLYNGTGTAGIPMLGTGDPIDFGSFTSTGTYSVLATNISSSCTNAMSGTANVSINPLPLVQTVAGGGTICQGSTGAVVSLNSSNSGINYQLYNGATPVGAPISGTGSSVSFGPQTIAGTYTVMATNGTTSCTRNMAGSVTVIVNSQPVAQTVTGGGNYCSGENGMAVGLASSATGINYQLYNGATAVGGPVAGTGGSINFGLQTAAGNYSVMATNNATSCSKAMTGIVTIGINALPGTHNVTGGGSYCQGAAGVGVVLASSTVGITYQLYNGTDPVGTPAAGNGIPVDFGLQTTPGTYRVVATNDLTGCHVYMNGSATVVVNPLPTQYAVNGGGEYCAGTAGAEIGMFPSNTGISYQLYYGGVAIGSPIAGNGGAISFGSQLVAGNYSVAATNNSTGCMNAMSGVANVVRNELPVAYNVTGGGSLCAGADGVSIMLSNGDAGVEYQLYNGSTAVGSVVSGAGGAINFGLQTAAGMYKVVAMNTTTSCMADMNGTATVVVNALPVAQTVTGGGSYCAGGAGVPVGLASSVSGTNYQLMMGTTPVGSVVAGTGSAISFGMQTAAGDYTVDAVNATTGCANTMTGMVSVSILSLPSTYAVLSNSSSYCAGEDGVNVLLSGSDNGISYQLYNGSVMAGTAVTGTGGMIDFGAQTAPGLYTVMASNTGTGCMKSMSGTASIVINPLPTAYTLTGGGGYCAGSGGADVNLNGSSTGVKYQLYNGAGAVGAAISGTGGPITFGPQMAGSYMVMATNSSTTCESNMMTTLTVVENALPTAYTVSGGGSYCAGGSGVTIGILGSSIGVNYQLYNGTGLVGVPVSGTGASLSFGSQTAAGMYHVTATNATTSCMAAMSGEVSVEVKALPAVHDITGGGNYCAGGAGVAVGLATSTAGVNYQLYNGTAPVSGAILAGDGAALDFGMQTASGDYRVMGTSTSTGCNVWMSGTATVVTNALPVAYAVTGGGHYCATSTSTGLPVGLSNSDAGISYQLYKDGVAVGSEVAGGGAISFGDQTAAGVYTVMGRNTVSTCTNNMAGSVTIAVNATVVPAVTVSSSNGTTVCIGVLTTFTATSVNSGTTPTYMWTVNGANVGLGLSTYQYVPADGDVVSVTMNSSEVCASPSTVSGSLTMNVSSHVTPVANVSVMPNDTVCKGQAVTYNVTPSFGGTAPAYRWLKNGVMVGSGTTFTYVPNDGDVVTCEMTSNFPCRIEDVVTTDVKMSVVTPVEPVVSISANPGLNIASGQSVRFTATASNAGSNPSYKWMINGEAVAGATNTTFTTSNLFNNDEVTCTVVNTSGPCLPMSGSKTVIVKVSTTGVSTVANIESDIRLLPNPNNGDFTIRGTTGITEDQDLSVDVTDMLGQVVYSGKFVARKGNINEKIQIGNTLANGMYILTLRSDNDKKTFHFVLQQ